MFLVLIIVYDDISSSEKSDIESLKATVKKSIPTTPPQWTTSTQFFVPQAKCRGF